MHSFKKERDGTYAVGQWLTGSLEYRFIPLFHVANMQIAMAAINTLNGVIPVNDFHILSEPKPDKRNYIVPGFIGFMLGALIGALMIR